MMRRTAAALVALMLAAPSAALAGRPMITDDARVATPKACQLETWIRHMPDATEAWALPACNPGGNLELAFGGARTRSGGESRFTDNLVQAKTLLHALGEDRWGLGVSVGTVRRPAREVARGWPGDTYVDLPLSVAVVDADAWVAHFNVGALRRRDTGRTLGTWAFGNEVRLAHGLFLVPEVFRADFGRAFYQAGMRYEVLRDRMQVNAAFGDRIHGASGERWYSVGVSVYSPPFLP